MRIPPPLLTSLSDALEDSKESLGSANESKDQGILGIINGLQGFPSGISLQNRSPPPVQLAHRASDAIDAGESPSQVQLSNGHAPISTATASVLDETRVVESSETAYSSTSCHPMRLILLEGPHLHQSQVPHHQHTLTAMRPMRNYLV